MSNEIAVNVDPKINKQTGEITAPIETVKIGTTNPEVFTGISLLDIPKDISDKLSLPVKLEEIEIKPTGEIYLSHIRYRKMLNDAFGMGNWALRPLGGFVKTGNIVCREYALYIKGKYAASAIGEQAYIEANAMMTWSDACEATKSNVIMRCCKDLGIALELWDKKFVEKFKKEYCMQVWCKSKNKPQWRLKESEPFFDETGLVEAIYQPKPEPRNPPAGECPISDPLFGIKTITGIANITSSRARGRDGKEFDTIKIYGEGDIVYSTTKKDLANMAKSAKEAGLKVEITHKNDKYNTILAITVLEPTNELSI